MKSFLLRILPILLLANFSIAVEVQAQRIDRKSLVRRHNPHIKGHFTDSLRCEKWMLGNGSQPFHVDATGLQTFVGDSLWPIATGLNFTDAKGISQLDATLDRWSGRFTSRFYRNKQQFRVETVYTRQAVATRITSDSIFEIAFRPQGKFMVETVEKATKFKKLERKKRMAVKLNDGQQTYWLAAIWYGDATVRQDSDRVVLSCKPGAFEIVFRRVHSEPSKDFFNHVYVEPFIDYALDVATEWSVFWNECGLADFSATDNPEARLTEQRMVEALYDFASVTIDDRWLLTPLALYGFPREVAKMLRMESHGLKKLTHRPEVIATADVLCRAYTYPYISENQFLTSQEVERNRTVVINAYAPIIKEAVSHLDALSVPYLDAEALRQVAESWMEAAADTTHATNKQYSTLSTSIFRLPPLTETLSRPASPETYALLLLSIAKHQFPVSWKVKTEYIIPLSDEKNER